VSEKPRRREDRIFDANYLDGIPSASMAELRAMRDECAAFEVELSYARRLLQGKLDIIRHALERRLDGGGSRIEALIVKLPSILSDEGPHGTGQRFQRVLLPKAAENQRRRVERLASETTLASIDELSSNELNEIVERLARAEEETSTERRRVQRILDSIHAELVRRYREGSEDPSALLPS
jgi:Mg2+ and Co2+ transporter CorA